MSGVVFIMLSYSTMRVTSLVRSMEASTCIGPSFQALDDSEIDTHVSNKLGAHACKAKITQGACTRIWVKEEVGRFDISVDDTSRMYVAQGSKHASEICLHAFER